MPRKQAWSENTTTAVDRLTCLQQVYESWRGRRAGRALWLRLPSTHARADSAPQAAAARIVASRRIQVPSKAFRRAHLCRNCSPPRHGGGVILGSITIYSSSSF
eukprot:4277027-Pleurochrysis_carterae.AAC.2